MTSQMNPKETKTWPDMVTYMGQKVYFDDPQQTEILMEDLRFCLGNICRYNGHAKWTLNQHLALCCMLSQYMIGIPQVNQLCALHDLHEVYIGDIVSGLKKFSYNMQELENTWEQYVHEQLGFSWDDRNAYHEQVKFIDMLALYLEMDFLNHPGFQFVKKKTNFSLTKKTLQELSLITQYVSHLNNKQCWYIIINTIKDLSFDPLIPLEDTESLNVEI